MENISQKQEKKRLRIRLKIALPVFFTLLVAFTGILIFGINTTYSLFTINKFSKSYVENIGHLVLEKTFHYLMPAAHIAELNTTFLNPDRIKTNYTDSFRTLAFEELKTYPQFALIYFGSAQGWFWMNARNENMSVSTQIVERVDDSEAAGQKFQTALTLSQHTPVDKQALSTLLSPILKTHWIHMDQNGTITDQETTTDYVYDPRLRAWYKKALESGTVSWTDAYLFSSSGKLFASGKPGITISAPVYQKETLLGVVGVDIILHELSHFLSTLTIGKNGRAFITNSEGKTIALKDYHEVLITPEGEKTRLSFLKEISDKAINTSYTTLISRDSITNTTGLSLTKPETFKFNLAEVTYLAYYEPFPREIGLNWLVGVVVPEDDFIGDIKFNLYIGILSSLIALIVVILISLFFSSTITRPLQILTNEANQIKDFHVDSPLQMESRFIEINNMTSSFINMKAGLRSFRKYVPSDLVRTLIQSGEEATLGGRNAEVTIYFSDIANFTTISESLQPKELVFHLGNYISEQSKIIEKHSGTVDKYIGDAIMAFWNAPQPVNDHALKACYAALETQATLTRLRTRWQNELVPLFYARIGIDTGEVIVGNMGSENRFNYTVIGDTVNQASRLEQLGKEYKVPIIISERTYQQVREKLVTRRLDKVTVKGKTRSVLIYQLLAGQGQPSEALLNFIRHYEQGLDAYFLRNWDQAIQSFESAKHLKPTDAPSQKLINRCRFYKDHPPGPEWQGEYVLTKK